MNPWFVGLINMRLPFSFFLPLILRLSDPLSFVSFRSNMDNLDTTITSSSSPPSQPNPAEFVSYPPWCRAGCGLIIRPGKPTQPNTPSQLEDHQSPQQPGTKRKHVQIEQDEGKSMLENQCCWFFLTIVQVAMFDHAFQILLSTPYSSPTPSQKMNVWVWIGYCSFG